MHSIYSIYDAPTEDWAAILGLAHHWQFAEVKSLVIRELEKHTIASIYKIVIYHRYNVDRGLLLPAYTDLVSREETLSLVEARDLGLETSLMIMTAREIVRKGEAPTSVVKISSEELRAIIRHVFRFPGPRSDSPLSDTTAAEPADHRSSPLAEKTELPTVPEHENEPITLSASASLNTPLPRDTEPTAPAPTIAIPIPPVSAPSPPSKQASSKPTPQKKEVKSAPVNPQKEEPKSKEEPTKSAIFPKRKEDHKPTAQEPVEPTTEEPSKTEAQDKKPVLARLADVSKGAGSPNSAKDAADPKDKDGDKPTDNKEAKDAKDKANTKDTAGPPADPNGTPISTPLLNQENERPSTPSTGQAVTIRYSVRHLC